MTPQEAVTLISDFAHNQCRLTKECNTNRGITKRSLKEEKRIATALFKALTGQAPTAEQLSDMEVK